MACLCGRGELCEYCDPYTGTAPFSESSKAKAKLEARIAALEAELKNLKDPPPPEPSPEDWVCSECGGDKIQALDWVEVNTGMCMNDPDAGDYFCPDCDTHFRVAMRRKDFTP